MHPLELPVYQQRKRILQALEEHQVIVVESPTGSGKTTQIPQILYEAGYADHLAIGVTQPRRIAAVSVAEFIARQRGTVIPDIVGYKMRFEDRTDETTRIKIMTDGILLQEIKGDQYLSRYNVMMVDEAHERSLNIDFILGLLKQVLRARSEFKVIVSSATINAEIFSEYFDECPVVKIDTKMYPVDVIYDPPGKENDQNEMLAKMAEIVEKRHKQDQRGDILIFLPGEGSIKSCMQMLQDLPMNSRLQILPLYSRLSSDEQEKVFLDYPGKTKVIAATNIAETSVTIDGVTCVIDSGLAKMNYYNNRNFTSSLIEIPISKASANQRRGRAGRTQPGRCYRLYPERDYEMRSLFTLEEIFRTDLSEVVLRMAELGIQDFENFDFIATPGREAILSAVKTLKDLKALDENRELTFIGRQMIDFPLLPRLSRIIVEAIMNNPEVLDEVLVAVSFLSTRTPFQLPPGQELEARKAHHSFRHPLGDFVSYLKIYRGFLRSKDRKQYCDDYYLDLRTLNEIHNIKLQLEEILAEKGIPVSTGGRLENYLCVVSRGMIQFVCTRTAPGMYRTLTAGKIQIHPGSVMFKENPPYMVAGEIVRTSRLYARSVSPLKKQWLKQISPLVYQSLAVGKILPEREKARRDFTNRIKIAGESFKIVLEKGKQKTVLLPWEKIRPLMEKTELSLLPNYKGLRGKVLFREFEILSGMKLNEILYLVNKFDPAQDFLDHPPRTTYTLPPNSGKLASQVSNCLALCRLKKKSKKLGFLALQTDGSGNYWFKGIRNYSTALLSSLASLESLVDEPEIYLESRDRDRINSVYRRLTGLLDGES